MKPRVGLTLFTSSFMILLTMVVFPALSRPLLQSAFETANKVEGTYSISIRISLSFSRAFRSIDSISSAQLLVAVLLYLYALLIFLVRSLTMFG
jgi:hypothetical protein